MVKVEMKIQDKIPNMTTTVSRLSSNRKSDNYSDCQIYLKMQQFFKSVSQNHNYMISSTDYLLNLDITYRLCSKRIIKDSDSINYSI
jgi:hypothetical protein